MRTEQELVRLIEYHDNKFWTENDPEISDVDYDLLKQELYSINPNHPIINKVSPEISGKRKVKSEIAMLSLDKIYNSKEDLIKWCKKVARNDNEMFYIQPKFDGCSAYNSDLLLTRGRDGYSVDISDKRYMIELETEMFNTNLIDHPNLAVRGEIVIKKSIFERVKRDIKKKDSSEYKNSRNACAGLLNRDDKINNLNFFPLTLIEHSKYNSVIKLIDLVMTNAQIIDNLESYIRSDDFDYPVDGIVIKLSDIEYSNSLGATSHHPKGEIAYKFANPRATSILKDVIWQVGKQSITPVGIIDPIYLAGAQIERVSLHNAKLILDTNIRIGDIVTIERAGEIIPYLVESSPGENRKEISISNCPSCNASLAYEEPNLICTNINCSGTITRKLYDAVKRLGIENLGLPTIEKINEMYHISTIGDILSLTYEDIINLPGFADQSARNLLDEIAKIKEIEEYQLLASLNIKGIGTTLSKKILSHHTLDELQNMRVHELQNIEQIGEERAYELYHGLIENIDIINDISSIINIKKSIPKNKGTICFSGKLPKPEKYYTTIAESKGYLVINNFSKDLTYLVSEDKDSTSSKCNKARQNNIPIISINELITILNRI